MSFCDTFHRGTLILLHEFIRTCSERGTREVSHRILLASLVVACSKRSTGQKRDGLSSMTLPVVTTIRKIGDFYLSVKWPNQQVRTYWTFSFSDSIIAFLKTKTKKRLQCIFTDIKHSKKVDSCGNASHLSICTAKYLVTSLMSWPCMVTSLQTAADLQWFIHNTASSSIKLF